MTISKANDCIVGITRCAQSMQIILLFRSLSCRVWHRSQMVNGNRRRRQKQETTTHAKVRQERLVLFTLQHKNNNRSYSGRKNIVCPLFMLWPRKTFVTLRNCKIPWTRKEKKRVPRPPCVCISSALSRGSNGEHKGKVKCSQSLQQQQREEKLS